MKTPPGNSPTGRGFSFVSSHTLVMAGLPGHPRLSQKGKGVDARVKPGHDGDNTNRLILYLGKIRDRARSRADFVEQLQPVLAHLGVVVIDLDLVEERIDRRAQFCHRAHR
jgi:hypothetical protein